MKKLDRVGERYLTNEGHWIEIVEYFNKKAITVQFDDGLTLKDRCYCNIKKGSVTKTISKVGERFITNEGYEGEIVEYFNYDNCTIKLKHKGDLILKNIRYGQIKTGSIFNPNNISVCNTGYMGIGDYSFGSHPKIYSRWYGMLERCYDKKYLIKQQTYRDVTVCEEWHNFQNFAKWHEENFKSYMEGWDLDKDILVKGNKIYSPETCCFVPHEINSLFTKANKNRGNLPIGVSQKNQNGGYQAVFRGKHIKTFSTVEEAFEIYKASKEKEIKRIADKWKDQITEECHQAMYAYEVEIKD